jgi:hypothetical protein
MLQAHSYSSPFILADGTGPQYPRVAAGVWCPKFSVLTIAIFQHTSILNSTGIGSTYPCRQSKLTGIGYREHLPEATIIEVQCKFLKLATYA